jgi:hypothetical protein
MILNVIRAETLYQSCCLIHEANLSISLIK